MKKRKDTWFNKLQVGDMVETAYGKEVIRKKYDDMLGFDANGRTNLNADGLFPIAISGCRPDDTQYIRKGALIDFLEAVKAGKDDVLLSVNSLIDHLKYNPHWQMEELI